MSLLIRIPRSGLFVDGDWVAADSNRKIEVVNPATERPIGTVADATVTDARRAVDAAARAQQRWQDTSPRERADLLHAVYLEVLRRRDEFAALIVAEMGKPLAEAQGEVDYSAGFFRWFAESAGRLHLEGQFGREPGGEYQIAVAKRPVGPCLLITPWNFPLAMGARKIAPALAAGCTVILKPSELTPLTSMLLAEIVHEVGVPAGVVNVVTTSDSPGVVATIMADPRVRKISFTGSTQVGTQLLKQAADNVMGSSMELGGNAPLIVFNDADIDVAVAGALVAKLRNGGESCVAANRIFVQDRVSGEFTARFAERMSKVVVGDGFEPDSEVGPLINETQRQRVASLVDDAVARGARRLLGGSVPADEGFFYPPTVLTEIPADAAIRDEEVFGPVAAIYEFHSEEEVIGLANATPYGLASYVFTQDLARALRVAEALDAGMTAINRGVISNPAAPFGGTKASGLGREGGSEGIEAYLESKYVGIQL